MEKGTIRITADGIEASDLHKADQATAEFSDPSTVKTDTGESAETVDPSVSLATSADVAALKGDGASSHDFKADPSADVTEAVPSVTAEKTEISDTAVKTDEPNGAAKGEVSAVEEAVSSDGRSSSDQQNKKSGSGLEIPKNLKYVALILLILFLSIYLISVVIYSGSFVSDASARNAMLYLNRDLAIAENLADVHYDNLYDIAAKLEFADSEEFVRETVRSYVGSEKFGGLRYYKNGEAYDAEGLLVENVGEINNMIFALSEGRRAGATEVYYDSVLKRHCIALFVPVKGSVYVDGLVSILPAIAKEDSENLISLSEVIDEKASVAAIIKSDGMILESCVSEGEKYNVGNNFYDFISSLANNNEEARYVREAVQSGEKSTAEINAFGEKYTVATAPLESFASKVYLVTLSESNALVSEDMSYIRHVINVMVLAIVGLAITLTYTFIAGKKAKESMEAVTLTDTTVECANAEQFRRSALAVVYSGKEKYALISANIRQYRYLNDQLGEEFTVDVLKFIVKVLGTFCSGGETFGYAGDGKFLMLYRFNSDSSLQDKIRLVEAIINKYQPLKEKNILIRFNVGVYHTFDGKRRTIPEMIECAQVCAENAKNNINKPFTVYTEAVREEVTHDEKIEAQMEEALTVGDFKLFLQPKYNVKFDRIDSAEALVRWFDPQKGEYMFPAEFIGLFETNGFIVKLDKFIYLEVIKFLTASAERGDNVVPISVNVSRVTAMTDEFVDFYVGNKKRSGIPDGLITLEFTESFAMENYEKLSGIVDTLHKNGILCSIDDFGTGYSSFNILKNIPMDELKLDRFFLKEGVDRERDEKITKMVIDLAKSINMTVVQEGVENQMMFDSAVSLGVEVIQGYHYAKAIPLEEYKIFVNSNTSIRFKAHVK